MATSSTSSSKALYVFEVSNADTLSEMQAHQHCACRKWLRYQTKQSC
jgi:hypothetical protein